jgi:putative flippase GtrA
LLVLAEHNGLRIHEVPVDWVDDPDSRVRIGATAREDLKGIWRLVRRFASGQGSLPAGLLPDDHVLPGLASQMARFAGIGATTTALFASLFLVLAGLLGPVGADAAALGGCAVLNTVANRRVTFDRRGRPGRRRQYATGMIVAAVPLVITVGSLLILGALGVTSLFADLVVVSTLNALAALARFVLLRRWVFR